MLCVPMWVDEQQLGSVSLYATAASGFTASDELLAQPFATQAALVLADASRTEQLRRAMATRDSIGQAKGILMERPHHCGPGFHGAFRVLAAHQPEVG
jgi:GAF domain-containing protein